MFEDNGEDSSGIVIVVMLLEEIFAFDDSMYG